MDLNSTNGQKKIQMDFQNSSNGHKNSSNGHKNIVQMGIKIVQMGFFPI